MNDNPTKERGLVLGASLILIAVALLAATVAYGLQSGAPRKGLGTILGGIYLQYLGVLFLLSYFFPHKTFLLRGLAWVCEHFSRQSGKWNAFLYFGLGVILGGIAIAQGFGQLK